jgi:hypothetical protein
MKDSLADGVPTVPRGILVSATLIPQSKADLAEFERKINALVTEETRLATQRHQLEHERDRIRAFIEMYLRYTGSMDDAAKVINSTEGGGASNTNASVNSAPSACSVAARSQAGGYSADAGDD